MRLAFHTHTIPGLSAHPDHAGPIQFHPINPEAPEKSTYSYTYSYTRISEHLNEIEGIRDRRVRVRMRNTAEFRRSLLEYIFGQALTLPQGVSGTMIEVTMRAGSNRMAAVSRTASTVMPARRSGSVKP